jgi:hypothetical protein
VKSPTNWDGKGVPIRIEGKFEAPGRAVLSVTVISQAPANKHFS